jgi:hypothetical protein
MAHNAHTSDFRFEVPAGWVDRTMIAWSAPPKPGERVAPNVLVAYDALQHGEDLAGYVNRQLKQLMEKARKFQLDLRQDTALAGRPAIEVLFQWDSTTGVLKQRQIYTLLSDGRAATFVHTAAAANFEKAEPHFAEMMKSFTWNPAD